MALKYHVLKSPGLHIGWALCLLETSLILNLSQEYTIPVACALALYHTDISAQQLFKFCHCVTISVCLASL